jgi:hypothetical protein
MKFLTYVAEVLMIARLWLGRMERILCALQRTVAVLRLAVTEGAMPAQGGVEPAGVSPESNGE